jgi:hypothetical protein
MLEDTKLQDHEDGGEDKSDEGTQIEKDNSTKNPLEEKAPAIPNSEDAVKSLLDKYKLKDVDALIKKVDNMEKVTQKTLREKNDDTSTGGEDTKLAEDNSKNVSFLVNDNVITGKCENLYQYESITMRIVFDEGYYTNERVNRKYS